MNEMPRNSLTVGEIQKITYWLREQKKNLITVMTTALNESYREEITADIKEIESLIARLEEQQIQ